MKWMERMNRILDYLEDHLTDSIDMDQIVKFSCCSNYNFERVFSFCMEIPLSEYIRNRKMSEAAKELCGSDTAIIEIALKYGYQSQEAFSRAFQKFHGVTPKQARDTTVRLNFYPKAVCKYKEENMIVNRRKAKYLLEKQPTAEHFKNKVPSPITLNFPVSMWSYMEYMGHNTNTMQTYTLIANLCGATFNSGLELTNDNGILTALQALGYPCSICSTRESDSNYISEPELRERIINELVVNKRPFIAVNMVDCCFGGVIVGYKEDGECLLNWGYFPFDFSDHPKAVITECRDWYKKTEKVIFLGERSDCQRELKDIYLYALKKAAEYVGTQDALNTEQFYNEWRRRLLENDTVISNEYSLIDPMWCDYAEKRFYAGQFMLQLKAFLPKHEESLNQLWNLFGREINGLMYEYISMVDLKPGEECNSLNLKKLDSLTVRQQMCDIVSRCESIEREAASIIAKVNRSNYE